MQLIKHLQYNYATSYVFHQSLWAEPWRQDQKNMKTILEKHKLHSKKLDKLEQPSIKLQEGLSSELSAQEAADSEYVVYEGRPVSNGYTSARTSQDM
ncbi:hypothetical protein BVRB_4g086440 [Beta vulgaris subsp. vulgaris]|nr:hypothetical protein BVRB_4g086440 [Beta vulgaris subsp. vulgaris]